MGSDHQDDYCLRLPTPPLYGELRTWYLQGVTISRITVLLASAHGFPFMGLSAVNWQRASERPAIVTEFFSPPPREVIAPLAFFLPLRRVLRASETEAIARSLK